MKLPNHQISYYHSTANYELNLNALDNDIEAEICIIGGGFTGINCAIELADLDISCVVLEAHEIGFGASGHNGGQLIRGLGHNLDKFSKYLGNQGIKQLEKLGLHSPQIVKNRIDRFNIKCDLQNGYCDLANTPDNFNSFQHEFEHLKRINYPHHIQLVKRSDMQQIVGSDNYYGGLLDMGSYHLHPLNLLLGETHVALSLGVQVFTNSQVIDINYGNQVTIFTKNGKITANKLIFACNAYMQGLNKFLDGKILPAGSYIITTEKLPKQITSQLIPQNLALCDQKIALDYFRLTSDNRLLFGGACHYSGRNPQNIKNYMRKKMLKVFPQLSSYKIDFSWGAMIGIGANRMPQIGVLPNHPNVYYAQAYSGHGINTTHLAAKILTDVIVHNKTKDFSLFTKIPHLTFPGGKYLRSYLLALGMFYYQLKDYLK